MIIPHAEERTADEFDDNAAMEYLAMAGEGNDATSVSKIPKQTRMREKSAQTRSERQVLYTFAGRSSMHDDYLVTN